MKLIVSFTLMFFVCFCAFSQHTEEQKAEIRTQWNLSLGTFQFEILSKRSSRALVEIRMDVINEILANRSESEVVYIPYKYNSDVRIKILPMNHITGDNTDLELRVIVDSFE